MARSHLAVVPVAASRLWLATDLLLVGEHAVGLRRAQDF
jgi:hypothetical protein